MAALSSSANDVTDIEEIILFVVFTSVKSNRGSGDEGLIPREISKSNPKPNAAILQVCAAESTVQL
jgi:hypothetical protein